MTRLAGLEILDTMVSDRESLICHLIPKKKIPRKRKPESQKCVMYQIKQDKRKLFSSDKHCNSVPKLKIVLMYNWYYFFTEQKRQKWEPSETTNFTEKYTNKNENPYFLMLQPFGGFLEKNGNSL